MKTLKHLVILLLLLGSGSLHSQDISINLSIRWSEGPYILKTDSIVKYPELVVSYTNNSGDNLYFRKFSHYRNGIPDFYYEESVCIHATDPEMSKVGIIKWLKQHRDYRNTIRKMYDNKEYLNNKFYVLIYLREYYYNDWETVIEEKYGKPRAFHEINYDLKVINDYLNDSIYGNIDERENLKMFFTSSDITKRAIKTNTTHQFMFLKAGETKEDVYNLTCFDIVKGTYTFMLNGGEFSDKVPYNWNIKETNNYYPLPKKVGKYKLYSGEFKANSVTITFE